jgi:hypothetical protein
MTVKCALALALLEGRVLTIFNCMKEIGYSNLPREVSRGIEKPFGVVVSRTPKETENRYGEPIRYYEYRLNNSEVNKEGREKMIAFCKEEMDDMPSPKTDKQARAIAKAASVIKKDEQERLF